MIQLLAPLSGRVLPIETVPDPVFSQKIVGDGIAIDPTSNLLLAPLAGTIAQAHRAGHAMTIQSPEGYQVLLHIGLDTVKLNGKGFRPKVKQGERVRAGQALIEFDTDEVAQTAKSLITLMVITEGPPHKLLPTQALLVRAGADPLLTIHPNGAQMSNGPQGGQRVSAPPLRIDLPTGLHARPAALLVSLAKAYNAEIELENNGKRGNAKSVVAIMGLEIANGDHVVVHAQGPDAERAVTELREFLADLDEAPPSPAPKAAIKPATRAFSSANVIAGVGVSSGLAIGRIHQIRGEQFDILERAEGDVASERSRLTQALHAAATELQDLGNQVKGKLDASRAAIFAAHRELLDDPDILNQAFDHLEQGKSAAYAWNQAISLHADRLARLNNEMMANRANDLRDVGHRVLRALLGRQTRGAQKPVPTEAILIAENLTPSETVQLDRSKVVAFCTTTGGATSHVAILARSLGLPAIAGIDPRILQIPDGTEVILDGESGEVRLNPSDSEKQTIRARQQDQAEQREAALALAHKPALTRDGRHIEVAANIGSVADARKAVEMGADGVGLLRSEFLFLERDTKPSEDEQYHVYQEIADILGPRPLVIRTLDVGGDKPLQYLPIPAEENPFLGVRGIRVGFRHPEILREQLRAILRVRAKAPLHVMFPMIASIEEFREAKAILEDERVKLAAPPVKVGVMIEVPSAALTAEALAKEVDFFSIGTNDLTQYTLAMDRGHKDLAKQVDALHPSVLRLIGMTAEAAHRHGKWVGVCGGLASDLPAVPILIGLGITELSVSLPTIPMVKSKVREGAVLECTDLAKRALDCATGDEVRALDLKKKSDQLNLWQGINHDDPEDVVLVPAEDR